jgi:energy-converting hydrogenase Eha subunit C
MDLFSQMILHVVQGRLACILALDPITEIRALALRESGRLSWLSSPLLARWQDLSVRFISADR